MSKSNFRCFFCFRNLYNLEFSYTLIFLVVFSDCITQVLTSRTKCQFLKSRILTLRTERQILYTLILIVCTQCQY